MPASAQALHLPRDRYLRAIQSITLVRGCLDRQGAKSVVRGISRRLAGWPFNNFLSDLDANAPQFFIGVPSNFSLIGVSHAHFPPRQHPITAACNVQTNLSVSASLR